MRVAIVIDTVLKPQWSEDWKELCMINSIEFKEFDSFDPDFIDNLLAYNPHKTLWRSGNSPTNKFKDEAQRQFLDKTNLRIVPNWKTHYLYDHKIRQSYLFNLHNIPHPKTRIFFKESYALEYIEKADYPFVVKADAGAGSKSFKFVENKEQALEIVNDAFRGKGIRTGREHEKRILYTQEYIPIPGAWRIMMFKDRIGFGLFHAVRPGTKKASGQHFTSHLPVPMELFDITKKINNLMGWDWGMYDFIWSKKYLTYLILEVTDTCGYKKSTEKRLVYYPEENEWIPKKEIYSPQEIIFRLFVLEDSSHKFEAPGC